MTVRTGDAFVIQKSSLDDLLGQLRQAGYETYGPRVDRGAIVYRPIASTADLPRGYSTEQKPGSFRLAQTGSRRLFDATPGADSWKPMLFPARQSLFEVTPSNGDLQLTFDQTEPTRRALIGVRACELAAIEVQDRVFLRPDFSDPGYRQRRENLFLVAVDCHDPAATCFCHAMGTGPAVRDGFDLALSELGDEFLVRVGSQAGASMIGDLQATPATAFHHQAAATATERAIRSQVRTIDTTDLPALLLSALDSPRWDQVGDRCLNCTSCTLVCPTCFCWDVVDTSDLATGRTERVRLWDSCFNPDHSYHAGGGLVRPTVRAHYRQWLTHKLGSWVEQFGVSGCVGCGRCITWCPAGIDITEEVAALRQEAGE